MMKVCLLLSLLFLGPLCRAQTAIDAADTITIGGIRQCVRITGADRSLPLLLFLHGGPGGSVMGYADKFTNKLKAHFIVIQWDQRETGRTRALNRSLVPLTLSLFQDDTHAMVDTLLRRFGRQKMYLAGHSWGTALGFHIARSYPECLYAFIAIGPMINQLESERIALARMKETAVITENTDAYKELLQVTIPFENGTQLYYHRKWLLDLAGSKRSLTQTYVEEWAENWLGVYNEASKENLFKSLPAIACPVYFFLGRRDYQTNSTLAEAYYRRVVAPAKGLWWFDCAHSIPTAEPERMQQLLIEKVLPETIDRSLPLKKF